jgi:hypothetical protein
MTPEDNATQADVNAEIPGALTGLGCGLALLVAVAGIVAFFIRKHGVCATACFGVDSRPGNLKTVAEIHASLDCSVANWLEARLKTL